MWRYAVRQPDVSADDGTFTDRYPAQERGVAVDSDAVLDYGMPRKVPGLSGLVVLEVLRSDGDSLIKGDMVPDYRSLADHDTGPVVYREMMPDLRLGMDVYSRF